MPSRYEVSFRQPATNLRPQFSMGDAAYGKAHVSYWEHQILFVGTTNLFQQWQAGGGMDHVIVLADNIQHRTSDMVKVNVMLPHLQLATEKLVLPKEIDTQFVKQSTGERDIAVHPAFKEGKGVRIARPQALPIEIHILP
jgi:hypothetical protein